MLFTWSSLDSMDNLDLIFQLWNHFTQSNIVWVQSGLMPAKTWHFLFLQLSVSRLNCYPPAYIGTILYTLSSHTDNGHVWCLLSPLFCLFFHSHSLSHYWECNAISWTGEGGQIFFLPSPNEYETIFTCISLPYCKKYNQEIQQFNLEPDNCY